jgi:hypothetical protein
MTNWKCLSLAVYKHEDEEREVQQVRKAMMDMSVWGSRYLVPMGWTVDGCDRLWDNQQRITRCGNHLPKMLQIHASANFKLRSEAKLQNIYSHSHTICSKAYAPTCLSNLYSPNDSKADGTIMKGGSKEGLSGQKSRYRERANFGSKYPDDTIV